MAARITASPRPGVPTWQNGGFFPPPGVSGMLPQIRLYIAPTDAASLRALAHLRALTDGPWAERCEWTIVDALSLPGDAPGPPRLPALARLEPAGPSWLPVDPAVAIPPGALTLPGGSSPVGAPSGAAPAPNGGAFWRAMVEASPAPAALFSGDLLVYANAAFRRRHELDDAALGRRPAEWRAKQRGGEVEAALGGAPATGIVTERLAVDSGAALTVVYVPPAGTPGARAVIDQIRTINHSIGNALVGVLGYGELLERELSAADAPSLARIRRMNEAATRLEAHSQEISAVIRGYLQQGDA